MYNKNRIIRRGDYMKVAKVISALGVLAMTIALLNGFINGNFSADGSLILSNPWGIVSIVDLYVGFVLFAMWIYFREDKFIIKVIWIVLLMVLGFFIGSLYVLYALVTSKNNWNTFFMGSKKQV
jgi:NhaP-type Na+/H+ or K+/H+ antiporter